MIGLLEYYVTGATAWPTPWPIEASVMARQLDVPWYRDIPWPVAIQDDHTEHACYFWEPVEEPKEDPLVVFEALFRTYYPPMVSALSARWGRDIAEEAVSEAWIAAWLRLVRIQQDGLVPGLYDKPVSWLYMVAGQCAYRLWLRSLRRRQILVAVDDLPSRDVTEQQVVNRLDVANALACLSPGQQKVLVLYYFCGYSGYEVSQLLGVTEQTVRSTLSQGRTRLRKLLTCSDNVISSTRHKAVSTT